MTPRTAIYLTAFLVAVLASVALTPLVKALALRLGVLDHPNERKVHAEPTPLWGGLAIAGGFFLAVAAAWIAALFCTRILAGGWGHIAGPMMGLAAGGLLILVVGLIDDRSGMRPWVKLLSQLAIGVILYASGIQLQFIKWPGHGLIVLPEWLDAPLTVLWVAAITNAINLLDGLDGLLAGVTAITSAVFFVIAVSQGQFFVAILLAALAGSCLGFLRYNFYPASVFMGDTGSLFLGLMLSAITLMGAFKSTAALALVAPICIMALPILDTLLAIIRRARSGRPIFQADKEHLHHRLLGMGLSQRRTVLIMYAVNIAAGAAGLILHFGVH